MGDMLKEDLPPHPGTDSGQGTAGPAEETSRSRRDFLSATAAAVVGAAALGATETAEAQTGGKRRAGGGVLLHGEDGVVYFVPQASLAPFKLPEPKARQVRAVHHEEDHFPLLLGMRSTTAKRLGLISADDEPTVVCSFMSVIRQLG